VVLEPVAAGVAVDFGGDVDRSSCEKSNVNWPGSTGAGGDEEEAAAMALSAFSARSPHPSRMQRITGFVDITVFVIFSRMYGVSK